MSWGQAAVQEDGPVQGEQRTTRPRKATELVRAFVGQITKEGDIVVASDSKSKLWRDADLKRAMQNWNMKYVDIARSPESALRVLISEIGEVGQ